MRQERVFARSARSSFETSRVSSGSISLVAATMSTLAEKIKGGWRNGWLQSARGSLPPPLLQNGTCQFLGIPLLSDAPSVKGTSTCPKARAGLRSEPSRLPLSGQPYIVPEHVSMAYEAFVLRSREHHRPHVCISHGFPAGIRFLGDPTSCAMRLAPPPVQCPESTHEVTSFLTWVWRWT